MQAASSKVSVSVVIPVYNAGKWLRRCLMNILNQGIRDMEVICVDDGSTDDSAAILSGFARWHGNLIVLRQENAGPGAARNRGLDAARGEYIAFVDANDWLVEHALQVLYAHAKALSLDMCCFQSLAVPESPAKEPGILLPFWRYDWLPDDLPVFFSRKQIGEGLWKIPVPVWGCFFRRLFLANHQIRFLEVSLNEDCGFTIDALLKAERMTILKMALHRHLIQDGNAGYLASIDDERVFDSIDVAEYCYRKINASDLAEDIKYRYFMTQWRAMYTRLVRIQPALKNRFYHRVRAFLTRYRRNGGFSGYDNEDFCNRLIRYETFEKYADSLPPDERNWVMRKKTPSELMALGW